MLHIILVNRRGNTIQTHFLCDLQTCSSLQQLVCPRLFSQSKIQNVFRCMRGYTWPELPVSAVNLFAISSLIGRDKFDLANGSALERT